MLQLPQKYVKLVSEWLLETEENGDTRSILLVILTYSYLQTIFYFIAYCEEKSSHLISQDYIYKNDLKHHNFEIFFK